ncbi:unnamed protein product, partial [Rotaria sordida]
MASVLQMIHIDNQSPSLLIDEEFLRNSMLVTKGYNDLAKRRLYRWTYILVVRRFHNIANLIAITNIATNFLPFCVFGQLFCAEYNNDNYENLLNKQKIIININIQKATQIHNEHLQNILPLNSETTSSSPNHSS